MNFTAKQKLCSKLGITENHLKGNNLFNTNFANSTKNSTIDYSKLDKGEKAIKFFTSANVDKKKTNQGTSAYQNFKIDILVPNNEPPRPINFDRTSYNKSNNDLNYIGSPNSTRNSLAKFQSGNKANTFNLDNLNTKIKMNTTDIYSPINRGKNIRQNDSLCRFLI